MGIELKKLNQQVVVITGATSGIGLSTARMAAKKGARLVLAARSEEELRRLTDEITADGGKAIYAVADVGVEADVRRIAAAAEEGFGGFDTWVNNAGVSIYGKLTEVPIADLRRLFETNVWGVVYGSLVAAERLRGRGGAIVNVGSVLSERAISLQGMYSASKHAVKGFTDALRMELEDDGAPVAVTLVEPNSIDTPFPRHAKNYMGQEGTLPPPVYAPETVARAILHCAEHPTRDVIVGGGGKGLTLLGHVAPRLTDKMMEAVFADKQKKDSPPQRPLEQNNVDHGFAELEERGGYDGVVMGRSLYTDVVLHPRRTGAVLLGAGLAGVALRRASQNGNRH